MIRRPPRSTLSSSSAASDVYKRQLRQRPRLGEHEDLLAEDHEGGNGLDPGPGSKLALGFGVDLGEDDLGVGPVSYTHLRAHETPEHLVCRLLLEKKKKKKKKIFK